MEDLEIEPPAREHEATPLLKPRRGRTILKLAAACAAAATVGLAALGGLEPPSKAKAALYAAPARGSLVGLDAGAQRDIVYDILVTEGFSSSVSCGHGEGSYVLCGEAACSVYSGAPSSLAACACKEERGVSTFFLGASNAHLWGSQTFRDFVVDSYTGRAGDKETAQFCGALTDGTICRETDMGCDAISFHEGTDQHDARRLGAVEVVDEASCMGAPCWYTAPASGTGQSWERCKKQPAARGRMRRRRDGTKI